MPIVDMTVDELEQYQGTNPKPVDFDEYWEKALDEMKSVDPQVLMVRADFQTPTVECYDMSVQRISPYAAYILTFSALSPYIHSKNSNS